MIDDYKVLIVEDDFRIADITGQFISKVDGFIVVGTVKTGEETLAYLNKPFSIPDLILLDVYIPDVKGLELFWSIRKKYRQIDIIMVTAANEVETVEDALRGGVFDYIVKPVDLERLEKTLNRYKEQRKFFSSKSLIEQGEIDVLTGANEPVNGLKLASTKLLPKGIDALTLDKIREVIQNANGGLTAVEVSKKIGASRSTARRYLEYLTSSKEITVKQKYGVGRPERRYVCEQNEQN